MPMASTLERSALRGWFKVCTRLSKMAGVILLYRFPCSGLPRPRLAYPCRWLGPAFAHSSFVSEVSIYEKGVAPGSASFRVINPVLAEGATPLDKKLAQWLEKGNSDAVSKVVDANGERLLVSEPLASAVR